MTVRGKLMSILSAIIAATIFLSLFLMPALIEGIRDANKVKVEKANEIQKIFCMYLIENVPELKDAEPSEVSFSTENGYTVYKGQTSYAVHDYAVMNSMNIYVSTYHTNNYPQLVSDKDPSGIVMLTWLVLMVVGLIWSYLHRDPKLNEFLLEERCEKRATVKKFLTKII